VTARLAPRRRSRLAGHRVRVFAVSAMAAVTVAGCGTRTRTTYEALAPPGDLSEVTTTTTSTTVATTAATTIVPTTTVPTELVALYFVGIGQLRRTERSRPRGVSVSEVLDLLAAGPDPASPTLRSAIPATPRVLNRVTVSGGVATVDLNPAVRDLPRSEQSFAFGQIVLTLTERPGVGQVRFTLGGSPLAAFLPDGSQRDAPVAKEDYQILLSSPPSTTTAPAGTSAGPTTSVGPTSVPAASVPAASVPGASVPGASVPGTTAPAGTPPGPGQ